MVDEETLKYIFLYMNTIQYIIETGHNISVDKLWSIANFIHCISLKYDSLLANTLLNSMLKAQCSLNSLKKKPEGKLQDKLLLMLHNQWTKDIRPLEAILLIVKKLIINGLISLLEPFPSAEAAKALALHSFFKKEKKFINYSI